MHKFHEACLNGDIDAVILFFEDSLFVNNDEHEHIIQTGLHLASAYGHSDIVEYIYDNHMTFTINDYFLIMCSYGHTEAVKKMIKRDDDMHYYYEVYNILDGFIEACKHGHVELVKYFIKEKMANHWSNHIETGFFLSCEHGHLEVAQLIYKTGKIKSMQPYAINEVAESGHMPIVKFMIECGETDFNGGLKGACQGGHLEIAQLMIQHGADNFNSGLKNACDFGNLELVELLIHHGADDFNLGLREIQGYIRHPISVIKYVKIALLLISKMQPCMVHWSSLKNAYNLKLYRLYVSHEKVYDMKHITDLINKEDPLYYLMKHRVLKGVPIGILMQLRQVV